MSGAAPPNAARLYAEIFCFNPSKVLNLVMDSESATKASIAIVILSSTFIVFTALSRLFLSPLARIPGPTLAALTSWYECYYDVMKPGQYVWKIKELHTQYGWFIMWFSVLRSD